MNDISLEQAILWFTANQQDYAPEAWKMHGETTDEIKEGRETFDAPWRAEGGGKKRKKKKEDKKRRVFCIERRFENEKQGRTVERKG